MILSYFYGDKVWLDIWNKRDMDGPLVMHRPISHIKNFSGKHFSGLFINNSGVLKRNMKKIYLSFYSTWDIYNFALLFTPSFIFTKYFIWTIQTVIGTITDPLDRYANLLVPSMSFYSNFIQILSWFYPKFTLILSWFYPNFI